MQSPPHPTRSLIDQHYCLDPPFCPLSSSINAFTQCSRRETSSKCAAGRFHHAFPFKVLLTVYHRNTNH